jgi:hypothetical protein
MASEMDLFAFEPNAERAAEIDRRIREGLAQSLGTICAALDDKSKLPPEQLKRLLSRIRSERVRPTVFALYTKLVHAIERDDAEGIGRLAGELNDPIVVAPAEHRIVTLSDETLRSDVAARYREIIDDDDGAPLDLRAVTDQQFEDGVECVRSTLDLLDRSAPELAGEIRLFGQELVFATHSPGAEAFGGATSLYLWGAMFINPTTHASRLAMAQALTHEAAHSLLFGMTMGGRMVENPDSERYASPLREDSRPMDGVVHATYVLARLLHCFDRLLKSDCLNSLERNEILQTREAGLRRYREGVRTTQMHARFTELGRLAFQRCVEKYPPQSSN